MNSTKVLKPAHSEQFESQFCHWPPFKVEKMPKHTLKRDFPPIPFPLKKEHVANPTKKRLNEEEKGKMAIQNKENVGHNTTNLQKLIKPSNPTPEGGKKKYFSQSLKLLEKEVKLAQLEFSHQEGPGDFYDDERVALEDEYGLPQDDIFKIDATDEYEEQPKTPQKFENFNDSEKLNKQSLTPRNEAPQDSCDGLKKSIDNDALIADVSTVDGLSMYEDLLEYTTKKQPEDEELEKIDIFFHDLKGKAESGENLTNFDCNFSKANEEDFEEEKINTCKNQTPSESYLLPVDFKDEEYELDLEKALYNSPMCEEPIPLMKKSSLRMERGLSLFEDPSGGFLDDLKLHNQNEIARERSYSRFTEEGWYPKDFENNIVPEPSIPTVQEQKFEDIQMEEPEFLKEIEPVMAPESENEELYELPELDTSLKPIGYSAEGKDMDLVSDLFGNPILGTNEIDSHQDEDEKPGSYKASPQKCTDEGLSDFNDLHGPSCF